VGQEIDAMRSASYAFLVTLALTALACASPPGAPSTPLPTAISASAPMAAVPLGTVALAVTPTPPAVVTSGPRAAARVTATLVPTPLSAPFAYGVASGDVTADSAVLWTRAAGPSDVTFDLATNPGFAGAKALPPVHTDAARDFTVKTTATGLAPGTRYYYRARVGDTISPTGSFKTAYAPTQDAAVTLGFSGDTSWQWKPYPLLTSLVQEKLDFFIFLGDLIYEDVAPGPGGQRAAVEDLAGYRFKYRQNREPRANSASHLVPMLDLYRSFGQYSVFDNHELGLSVADKQAPPYLAGGTVAGDSFVNRTPGFHDRIEAYEEYQPVHEVVAQGTGDPRIDGTHQFYYAVPWGANADLIVLDDRSYRDVPLPTDNSAVTRCDRTILGAAQLKWFEDELLAAKARKVTWKLVVISSPIQQLGTKGQLGGPEYDGPKSWAGDYVCERNKVLQFIDANAIDNVVFLTTDDHITVINNLSYNAVPDDRASPLKPARNAFEILTGPLGASPGIPWWQLGISTDGLPHDLDRRTLATWNGDSPGKAGTRGLKQAGLDPIGLEPSFPGLVASSVHAAGGPSGTVAPIDFANFQSFSYAVLTLDRKSLTVQVKGIPMIVDPSRLDDSMVESDYEGAKATDLLGFQVMAQ
jgi:phosphodiesterase/alkaline phosphatase D-like protein